jgi:hypothetical protein
VGQALAADHIDRRASAADEPGGYADLGLLFEGWDRGADGYVSISDWNTPYLLCFRRYQFNFSTGGNLTRITRTQKGSPALVLALQAAQPSRRTGAAG